MPDQVSVALPSVAMTEVGNKTPKSMNESKKAFETLLRSCMAQVKAQTIYLFASDALSEIPSVCLQHLV